MSWKASGYVKDLTTHADGTKLSAREKLILFVLADSHNANQGNCAWIGIEAAAKAALTGRARFITLIQRLEERGTIYIERQEGRSNRYFFPGLKVEDTSPITGRVKDFHPSNFKTPPVQQLLDPTRPTAIGPEPPLNLKEEPSEETPAANLNDKNQEWEQFQERERLRKDREAEKQSHKGKFGRPRSGLANQAWPSKGVNYGARQSNERRESSAERRLRETEEAFIEIFGPRGKAS